MSDQRLTASEVQLVLRRAAELEHHQTTAEDDDDRLAPAEVEELARDVGLSPLAVHQALAEARAGTLQPLPPQSPLARVLGPQSLVVERTVHGRVTDVQRRVDRFLRAHLLRRERDFGERSVWAPARGVMARVRRALDWTGELTLGELCHLEVTVVGVTEDRTTVRFVVDVAPLQRQVLTGAALGTAVGLAAAAGLSALGAPIAVDCLIAAGASGTGAVSSLRLYRRQVTSTATALEHLLDSLEHDRATPSALDFFFAR
jgi:hypothetical protein